MPAVPFQSLPPDARAWVFGAVQPVLGRDAEQMINHVDGFVHGWVAHGEPVIGSCDWRYDRFLLVAADERATGVSGCSIDALFRILKAVEREFGVTLLDSSPVWYRDESGLITAVPRAEFRKLVRGGEVGPDTIVFDNTVSTVGQIEGGEWERPLCESWHGRAFRTRPGAQAKPPV
ncbi:MAG TPA: hypothetical protein VMN39_07815 [Longimicrobiaceae bacterium]|nr:hypothetical protein [Longimicrobiaceae bacterium]